MSTGTQVEVVMPQMGVSVSEGTVTRWLKQPGETIALDEPLLEISTDKVDTEVPSPGEGVVAEIRVQEGETVEVGTVSGGHRPGQRAVRCRPSPSQSLLLRLTRRRGGSAVYTAEPPSAPQEQRARACSWPRSRRLGATARRSSRRSSRGSRRSTGSTRA